MRLAILAFLATLSIAGPAYARHHDRDDHRGHEEGNGFHRYYGSEYGVTDQTLRSERRDGGDRRDDGRERRRDGHERREPIT